MVAAAQQLPPLGAGSRARERAIIIHDPYHDDALPPAPKKRRPAAAVPAPGGGSLAIPFHDFERMSVWGKHRLRAAIVLEQKTPS
ncbi:MAG: hypothetical protein U1F43_38115 [Myxococcota bacterium]